MVDGKVRGFVAESSNLSSCTICGWPPFCVNNFYFALINGNYRVLFIKKSIPEVDKNGEALC